MPAARQEVRIAPSIVRKLGNSGMGFSVHLDDEACGHAGEISNVRADGMLPSKASSVNPIMAQARPQNDFRVRHLTPQAFGQRLGSSLGLTHSFAPTASLRSAPHPLLRGR